jgi:hypothetical protein
LLPKGGGPLIEAKEPSKEPSKEPLVNKKHHRDFNKQSLEFIINDVGILIEIAVEATGFGKTPASNPEVVGFIEVLRLDE